MIVITASNLPALLAHAARHPRSLESVYAVPLCFPLTKERGSYGTLPFLLPPWCCNAPYKCLRCWPRRPCIPRRRCRCLGSWLCSIAPRVTWIGWRRADDGFDTLLMHERRSVCFVAFCACQLAAVCPCFYWLLLILLTLLVISFLRHVVALHLYSLTVCM